MNKTNQTRCTDNHYIKNKFYRWEPSTKGNKAVLSGAKTEEQNFSFRKRNKIIREIRNHLEDSLAYYRETGELLPMPKHLKQFLSDDVKLQYDIENGNVDGLIEYIMEQYFNQYTVYGGNHDDEEQIPVLSSSGRLSRKLE